MKKLTHSTFVHLPGFGIFGGLITLTELTPKIQKRAFWAGLLTAFVYIMNGTPRPSSTYRIDVRYILAIAIGIFESGHF